MHKHVSVRSIISLSVSVGCRQTKIPVIYKWTRWFCYRIEKKVICPVFLLVCVYTLNTGWGFTSYWATTDSLDLQCIKQVSISSLDYFQVVTSCCCERREPMHHARAKNPKLRVRSLDGTTLCFCKNYVLNISIYIIRESFYLCIYVSIYLCLSAAATDAITDAIASVAAADKHR